MVTEPQFVYFYHQARIIPNLVAIPFCVSALGVYLYNVIFNGFRSYKFGLILLIMSYNLVCQFLSTRIYPSFASYWSFYAENLVLYSYLLSPLNTWLFSAQYFESASLIVEFERKKITSKCTRVLFAVVTAGLIVLYFATAATSGFSDFFFTKLISSGDKVYAAKYHYWTNLFLSLEAVTVWSGVVVNLGGIAFMLLAIHLIKRKVKLINQGFGGTVH